MTRRLLRSSLGYFVLLLLVTTTYAQGVEQDTTRYYQYYRASESLFFQGRLGLNFYGGDRDVNPFDEVQGYIENIGFDFGLEAGYHFSDRFSLSLMHLSGLYPRIKDEPFPPVADYPGYLDLDQETTSKWRHHFSVLGRVQILPLKRVSPYYHMGFNVSLGKINDEMKVGVGPTVGIGIDAAVSDRMGIFLELDGIYVFGDGTLDLADTKDFTPQSLGRGIDASDFDAFPFFGFGLRYNLKSPLIPIVLDCTSPGTLRIGEQGTFAATTNEATRPITYEWSFGDGQTGASGILVGHTYSTAGDYVATVTATNRAGTVSANCPVTVLAPPTCQISGVPSTLSMCQQPLQAVQFRSTVTGDSPITYSWNFGDGTTSTQTEPTHTYTRLDANQNTTTNTTTLTVTNDAGSAMCTTTITIEPCECVSNLVLAQVVYDRNESILKEGQTMENLQNNVEILRNSASTRVFIEGFATANERNAATLATDRARAIATFYTNNGIDESRIMIDGTVLPFQPKSGVPATITIPYCDDSELQPKRDMVRSQVERDMRQ